MKILPLLFCGVLVSGAAAAPLKIGAVYCNAGPQKALDEPSWRGAQAAVALRNKSGGINGQPVELIRIGADSRSDRSGRTVRTDTDQLDRLAIDAAGLVAQGNSGLGAAP